MVCLQRVVLAAQSTASIHAMPYSLEISDINANTVVEAWQIACNLQCIYTRANIVLLIRPAYSRIKYAPEQG